MPVLSTGFAWPAGVFYEGASVVASTVVPAEYPVAIAGHPYFIEPSLYRLTHIPLRREARDETAEPGEQSINPAGLWRRSQSDWSLGAGQLWLDEQESTRRRFRESLGIDVFNDREFLLLPATEEKRDSANTNHKLLRVGTRLYYVDGAGVAFSNGSGSEQNTTWVTGWTAATGLPGGSVLDIAFSGSHVYVLGSDNSIYRATPGTAAFAPYYNPAEVAIRIFTGLGRLFFVSDAGQSLFEVTSAGTAETIVFSHPDPNYVISSVVGCPTGLYFAGNIGTDFGEIRRTVVNTGGTAFDPPIVAAEFTNEAVYKLAHAGNNILAGTSVGFRYASITDSGPGLDFGPAVEVGAVRDIVVDSFLNPAGQLDTFAYFTWPGINDGTESGLGRIRVTRFTEPNVPAYASDIFTSVGGTPLTVASIGGRRYFGVSTEGFYGATSNFVEEGELHTGRIRYGLLDQKNFNDLQWRTAPLNGQVEAEIDTDDGNTHHVGLQEHMDSVSHHGHITATAEWAEIVFMLRRGGVITPALHLDELTAGSATTPDHANFAITDLDAEITLMMDNWTPGGSTNRFLFGQSGIVASIAWGIFIDTTGAIGLSTSPDGTSANAITQLTTTVPDLEPESEHTIGVTLDVNNGAGGRTYNFTIDGTLFETITVGATTSIFNSAAALTIGGGNISSTVVPTAQVLSATFRASIGGADVANPDFTIQEVADTSFADTASTPKTWTVNSPAVISLVHESEELSPRLRWWVMRAIPSIEETMQILVPLRLTEKEKGPYGPAKGTAFLDELDFLMSLSNSKQIVTYQEGLRSYTVYVNNIETNPTRWNAMDQGLEGIIMVELHTTTHP